MKLCTTCGRRWDVAGPRCPDDGTPLEPGETGGGDRDGSAGAAIGLAGTASAARASASATWSAEPAARAQLHPAARDGLAPGACVGEYVIERRIGAGGMGVVYGARHPVIGKRAAIKILNAKLTADDGALSRFVLEAQAVNRIGHANIVDIFSFGMLDDGRSYFAMEWLQGETLGQRLERGRLAAREAIAILSPLCRALEAAHAAGVIHRDLKPDNVFLATDDDGWRVKLLDFGIAKLSTPTAPVSRTATGVAMGTPLYMAPEQARGEAVDGRTDVYALGLLAYTMVCGASLFEDQGSAIEILAAHISRPPVPPRERAPDLPAAFDALILEMIAKQPDQRPAPSEIRRRLSAIAAADRPAPPAPTAAGRPAPPVMAGAPTLPGIAGAPGSHPPTMPGAPPTASQRAPLLERLDAPPVAGAAVRRSSMPASAPIADRAHGSERASASRRRWWPLGLAALVAAATAGAVIGARGGTAPVAAGPREARVAQPPDDPGGAASGATTRAEPGTAAAPGSAAPAPASPDPAPASPGAPPAPGQVTAEIAVDPSGARLVVDGQPVPLVAGRATIALPPGDHEALASAGSRVVRQRFTVAAGRAARVALRVPPAPATPAPPAPHAGVDVDGVEDPFRR